MRKTLRLAAVVLIAVPLLNCSQALRGLKVGFGLLDASHHLEGYVCRAAEWVRDEHGMSLGVRLVVAALGDPCETGGRDVHISAALEDEVRKALALELGQAVDVDGDLAEREPVIDRASLVASPPSSALEPIYATHLRPGRR